MASKSIDEAKIQGLNVGVYGTQGSGKTEMVKHLARTKFKAPFVITPHLHDFQNVLCYLYITKYNQDMEELFKHLIRLAKAGDIDAVIVDEADMFFQNNHAIKEYATDLFSNHRHYPEGRGVSLIFVSRRPQELPTKFVESCPFNIVYKVEGENVKKKFNGIREGFGDTLVSDDFKYKGYEYYLKEIGEAPVLCAPVPMKKETKTEAPIRYD